jgi:hypothetical protein
MIFTLRCIGKLLLLQLFHRMRCFHLIIAGVVVVSWDAGNDLSLVRTAAQIVYHWCGPNGISRVPGETDS